LNRGVAGRFANSVASFGKNDCFAAVATGYLDGFVGRFHVAYHDFIEAFHRVEAFLKVFGLIVCVDYY
jgi:hypothetical protein